MNFRVLDTLGVFIDNHDLGRISSLISGEEGKATILTILTYLYMSYGIPIMYYGTEAGFYGNEDPYNREVFDPLDKHKSLLDIGIITYVKTLN